ncbi:uncharacterized protein LOC100822752 [Brachypodium distachyon]|uniref:Uncharacterized protein n=1 Tax=Brachypodium distachyon TaxID=15368 RepID=I1HXQ0_BRADI|nr:uncharacterized protein LOC100822752 [Brachypodium distachyon]KQJ93545.1 hypothetical protein BRADI_3g05280v3 [Brachypodium distachyon]|eukprot:XP_003570987.1 uncharacterized protein LOC100822752 [Brachypodium distachyon]
MAAAVAAAESAPSTAPSCLHGGHASQRCCGGGGCGLGRLVRRLRRQGRQALCAAARPTSSSALRGCQQYDPLSYARNFDSDGADADAASLYYSYTFSSRFVLPPPSAAAGAPTVLVTARPTAASH